MIKVNLLKNRGVVAEGEAAPSMGFETAGPVTDVDPKEVFVKILCVLGFTGGLMIYESNNIDNLNFEKRRLESKASTIEADLKKRKKEAGKAEEFQKEIQEIEKKMTILKGLAKLRLIEIRSLDLIQNLLPDKVWLVNLSYKNEEFLVKGVALSESVLNQFIGKLEGSGVFTDVILLKSSEKKTADAEIVREFVISSRLEIEN